MQAFNLLMHKFLFENVEEMAFFVAIGLVLGYNIVGFICTCA
jgi:hypothetical protein